MTAKPVTADIPLSFVITTYNVRPYIERCLTSLAACARAGDRVILVDDGSTDGTAEEIHALMEQSGFAPGVTLTPVLLGSNTMGGVGIAGNVGLYEALSDPDCEAVFFVDGDDWLVPAGFTACRRAFATTRPDILLGNYREYDEGLDSYRNPADSKLWLRRAQQRGEDHIAKRDLALAMIAVPWRKFYRADFLRRHDLRFPEGDFFFEDNPFHWEICLKAASIAFCDQVLCQHRINRPGQTMASTGIELAAFFDHYATIQASLPSPAEPELEAAALRWLLNNMSWHVERLRSPAQWPYADRAARILASIPETVWQAIEPHFAKSAILPAAAALRRGDISGVANSWLLAEQGRTLSGLQQEVDNLTEQVTGLTLGMNDALRPAIAQTADQVSALFEVQQFQALTSTWTPPPESA